MSRENSEVDLKAAINAISDVVQNRPRPLRELDQIYMKTGDMVLQSEIIARWSDGKRIAFIGDGDAISVSIEFLQNSKIFEYGPSEICVFDFDERICNAISRFADSQGLENLKSYHYNCIDAFPRVGEFDLFYTNPPWGASNGGESVNVFMQRGFEAVGYSGEGVVVIADDDELEWPRQVLANVQAYALKSNYYVSKMSSKVHLYHLDDNPDLKSCNLFFNSVCNPEGKIESCEITDRTRLENFYGEGSDLRIRYVKELARVDYGKANDSEYEFLLF